MEASEKSGAAASKQREAAAPQQQRQASQQQQQQQGGQQRRPEQREAPRTAASMGAQQTPLPASADTPLSEVDHEDRAPAREQAPVAHDLQEAIMGDPGLRGEQQPFANEGNVGAANMPHATSAPPPSAQSGVPLAEDRAAGVQPGPKGPVPLVGQGERGEREAS